MNELQNQIIALKNERNAVILAHNYVPGEIQEIADFTGDSLELSIKAAQINAPIIVMCGVKFMAETAKLLSPNSTVILPCPDAGCPMADMANSEDIRKMRAAHPDAVFVAYVNTTAETKAEVDICCTSGNAEKIIKSIPKDKEIIFLPDRNLGTNMTDLLNRPMTYWQGCCPIHDLVTPETIKKAKAAHPNAKVMIHPECRPEAVAVADVALSTAGMLKYIKESGATEFIVATEIGILHRMRKENPNFSFYALDPEPVCIDMKKFTLEKVYNALKDLNPEITIPEDIAKKAVKAINNMLAVK